MPIPKRTCKNAQCRTTDDPVNLRFLAPVNAVLSVLNNDGWNPPGPLNFELPAVDQYLCDRAGQAGRKQDAQRVRKIGYRGSRYHVRIWNYAGGAESLGSAHAEKFLLSEGHVVMTFESGEQEVALSLAAAGWTVDRDADHQEDLRTGKFDSGKLTEVSP